MSTDKNIDWFSEEKKSGYHYPPQSIELTLIEIDYA